MSLSKNPVEIVSSLKVNNQPQHKGAITDEKLFETISLKGLPEGTTAAQVARCNHLLKHISDCAAAPGTCAEGGACRRTKQILAHHLGCLYRRRGRTAECSVCQQLLALCRIHSQLCQDDRGNCTVLYCKNKRVNVSHQNQTQPASSTEHQQMLRKLFINLLLNKKNLEDIGHLRERNHPAAAHSVFGKKLKSQPASASHEIKNQTISKELKTERDKSLHQRFMYTNMLSRPCKLKLDVLVTAPFTPSQLGVCQES